MKNILTVSAVAILIIVGLTVTKNEIQDYKELKQIKNNIENMIENNYSMETIKENRKNVATIEGDKVIIIQNVGVYDYEIILNKNHKNIVDSILMYMTGHNAFNQNIDDVQISFSSVKTINNNLSI